MTVYQIIVKGEYKYFSGEFKCSSSKVYREKPTQEMVEEFVKKCATPPDGKCDLYDLDLTKPYTTGIVELEVV